MNCTIIQRRLLGTEDPAHPPDEIQVHLDGCTCCRDWQALLLQMEQNVALLPVPPSDSRAEFLQRLPHTPVAGSVNGTGPPLKIRVPELVRRRAQSAGRQRFKTIVRDWMPVIGAAAALLLVVFGWSEFVTFRRGTVTNANRVQYAADPLVAKLMQHHLALVNAKNSQTREMALTAIAGELEQEIGSLATEAGARDTRESLTQLRKTINDARKSNVFSSTNSSIRRADARRLDQLKRNRKLIERIVEQSVMLVNTKEDDALAHAAQCEKLVVQLAGEITDAAQQGEGGRAEEMSGHFRDLLEQGVAANLKVYARNPDTGSVAQRERKIIGAWSQQTADELEKQLEQVAGMQPALEAVRLGRESVREALKAEAA